MIRIVLDTNVLVAGLLSEKKAEADWSSGALLFWIALLAGGNWSISPDIKESRLWKWGLSPLLASQPVRVNHKAG